MVFAKGADKDLVVLLAARASRLENQDAIDTAIVQMLGDHKEVLELQFCTIFENVLHMFRWHVVKFAFRAKGFDTVISMSWSQSGHFLPFNPTDKRTALPYFDDLHRVSKGTPEQAVPASTKDSPGGPWEFVDLLPLFDPPCHDSAGTIRRALDLGVSVNMIRGVDCC
ncbi:hypothetical protein IFM89_034553 [Coptis chinensis]|uniref:Uncharacterized protein n=1 Tax=Coptis chinensis TaxID=261450 RepID=A0A835LQ21_9MAGN|nr:hypothetical protein IFM89_034553 [Coptis chinensis]